LLAFLAGLDSDPKCRILRMTVEAQDVKIMKNVFSLVPIIDRDETKAGDV
jgi:hypothetical protein